MIGTTLLLLLSMRLLDKGFIDNYLLIIDNYLSRAKQNSWTFLEVLSYVNCEPVLIKPGKVQTF